CFALLLNATSRALASFNPLGKTKTLAQQAHGNPEPRDRRTGQFGQLRGGGELTIRPDLGGLQQGLLIAMRPNTRMAAAWGVIVGMILRGANRRPWEPTYGPHTLSGMVNTK